MLRHPARRRRLAVNEEHAPRGSHAREPAADLASVAVAGEGVDAAHGRPHRDVPAVDREELGPIDERAPTRAGSLETGDEHRRARVGESTSEVVEDPPSVHHAAGGDHDPSPIMGVDRLRFLGGPRHPHPG